MSLINELSRRNVFRVGAAYIVFSWLIIQVAETLFPLFGFGDGPARLVVIVLAIGLVPVIIVSWAFELTPQGLKRDSDVDHSLSVAPHAGKKLDRIIMVVLMLALGYFVFDKFVLDPARDADLVEETTQQARSDALLESYGDRSIAVLPFVDMSVKKDQEYMSDGIAEELLNLLARIPGLRVVSRSSAFAFKGKDIDIPSIADQLKVAYVLEGSVRQAGDQLRITAQLIEAASDTHLWSETYDRKLENIFDIQDEISGQVVDALKITLLGEAPRTERIDEQAYKLALQARYYWNRRSEGDEEAAFKLYQQALELAPEYAPAWAGISVAYADRAMRGQIPREDGEALAREAAEKALQLDPELADAHIRMAQALGREGDFAGKRKAIEAALALEPNNPTALSVMAFLLSALGNHEEAIRLFQKAEAVDPLGALWPMNSVPLYLVVGRFEEAEQAARRAYDLNGNDLIYWRNLSYIYTVQGRHQEALDALQHQFDDLPSTLLAEAYMQKAVALNALGRQKEAQDLVNKMDAMDDPYETLNFTILHALQGDMDKAFEWLEKSHEFPRYYFEYQPYLRNMMGDPRWKPSLEQFESAYETPGK